VMSTDNVMQQRQDQFSKVQTWHLTTMFLVFS
jgi:hypothetical protein